MDVTKPYEFMRFGAMDVTTPYKFIWFVGWVNCSRGGVREEVLKTPKIDDCREPPRKRPLTHDGSWTNLKRRTGHSRSPPGPGLEASPKSGPGGPTSAPSGSGKAYDFVRWVGRLVPGPAGRGGGPLRPPSGCLSGIAHVFSSLLIYKLTFLSSTFGGLRRGR